MTRRPRPTPLNRISCRRWIADLAGREPGLAAIVAKWGEPPFWTHPAGFAGLVLAILAQQVSLESAQAAYAKLEGALGAVSPEGFLSLSAARLKAVGFSRQKASYVAGIARSILAGWLALGSLRSLDDDQVRARLIEIRGIGPWTADTYLLFSLRRPDAWPSGDLALAKAVQDLHGLKSMPAAEAVDQAAERWRPCRAVAARILWHSYLCERGRAGSA